MKTHDIEDLYELSPLQQGMLFHVLASSDPDVYLIRLVCDLEGTLDPDGFARAWQSVVDQTPVLRTSFHWQAIQKPLQIVHRRIAVPLDRHDWRDLPEAERADRLRALLEEQSAQGVPLDEAPLIRLRLIRTADRAWQLVWTFPHILLEGWSASIVLNEVFDAYAVIRSGRRYVAAPRPRYRDYIAWMQQQDPAAAEAYWRRTLRGFTAPTPLGVDRQADASEPARYTRIRHALPDGIASALQKTARAERLTLNTLYQGAWALLLSRYSGERDVVFGSVVSGREVDFPRVESLVGLCVNTLPARVQVADTEPVSAWLRGLQGGQSEMRAFQYASLIDIQRWSEVPRGGQLFESIFVFENWARGITPADAKREIRLAGVRSLEGNTGYPLVVEVAPGPETTIGLAYDTRRLDTGVAERLLRHYEAVLAQLAAPTEARLRDMTLLTDEEQRLITIGWNRTDVPYRRDVCVHDRLAQQVSRTPDAIAVRLDDRAITYADLLARGDRLAAHLRALGVRPGVLVGVCAERSIEMVVALVAVLRAGGAYVPLDPAFPRERLSYMVEDSACPILLVDRANGECIPGSDARRVFIDDESSWTAGEPEGVVASGPDDLAYVIYTSGSTGRPKGVQVCHGALVNFLGAMETEIGVTRADRLVAVTTLSFDIAGLELYLPLTVGAEVVLAARDTASDGSALALLLERADATIMQATPATWRLLIESGWGGRAAMKILCGGESLSRELATDLLARGAGLWNLYGPTETTIWSAIERVEAGTGTVAIGRPIANTQLYVLDERLDPVAPGVRGELFIGGDGLARGYANRADLTAERFLPSPFGPPGARMYRTGDLARHLADGRVECVGRADHQLKIRGFRIEPGEIEAALRRHADVADAVVIVREDRPGDRQLVGYVRPAGASAPAPSELRAFLRERIPEYMIPAVFVSLEEWPLTPNGKIDRKALPPPDGSHMGARAAAVGPRTPLEELLAGVWCDVLGVASVGVHDNFFDLGGHSLRATQLVSRVRAATGLELPLRRVFQTPTIAELARDLEAAGGAPALPPLRPAARDGVLPLSFAQERLWVVHQLNPSGAAYNLAGAVRLDGELNVPALERSFGGIVDRHESLRTAVDVVDGRAAQAIHPALTFALPVVDLTALDDETRGAEMDRQLKDLTARPFDLASPPLMRALLIRLGPAAHVLGVVMHHMVSDAWSINVFVRELSTLYAAFVRDAASPLPALPVQYADFASWQRGWLQGDALDAQVSYWRERLRGAPLVLDLPADRPRPAVQEGRGARQSVLLPRDLSDALIALSRREGVTLYMALLAAFQLLLHRYTGQHDFLIGSPIAGRTRVELEGLIGFFANTLVMRAELSDDPDVAALLARVREGALGAYLHQDVPFEKLVDGLQPVRDLSRNPVVQVMFALQNAPAAPLDLTGLTWLPQDVSNEWSPFDLTLFVHESPHGLLATFQYCTDLFEDATIARMHRHFQQLLSAMVAHPRQRVSGLTMLTADEQQQILVDWNRTEQPVAPVCVHQLFEAQVDRAPAALAVACGPVQLTYGELEQRANRLAHYLRANGVGPEVCVAICLNRSADLLVAILGTLKAGGAYVPLDPTYPAERLQYMIDDSRAPLVLTERALMEKAAGANARAVSLDDERSAIARASDARPASAVTPRNLAYAIYTSGSTGRPKGVQIEHAGLANLAAWHRRTHAVTADDRATQLAGLGFDATVWEVWPYLTAGASVHLPDEETRLSAAALVEWLASRRITITFLPTPLLEAALQLSWPPHVLRRVLTGGDRLHRVASMQTGFELFNQYGPTENSVVTTWCVVDEVIMPPPIGRPVDNTRLYVLDGRLRPVPVGVPGELHIGGLGLSRGYLNRADLTAERFIPDPFGASPGGRLYKTGDLVRYLPDGHIDFLGRSDGQVKIRGFRIELAEIEAVLLEHPAVRQAAVIAREDAPGDRRLAAYVVGTGEVSVRELRAHLAERLPGYMVPAAFVVLDALPLNASGKVDQRALPAPPEKSAEIGSEFVAAQGEVENLLARIWARALRVERVGVHDNFFELGGDSIMSLRIVAAANEAGLSLTARDMFQRQTIAELAAGLDAGPGERAQQGPETGDVPLTPIQHDFFGQELDDPHHFNQAVILETRDVLQRARVDAALQHLQRHHDALRLRFTRDGAVWRQTHAGSDADAQVTVVDLSGMSPAEQDDRFQVEAARIQSSLDLGRGPLLRAALVRRGPDRPDCLLMVAHHLVIDGVSWRVLLTDFQTAYEQLGREEPVRFPPKTTSFRAWSLRLQDRASKGAFREELDFWRSVAAGASASLPTDRAAGTNVVGSARTVKIALDADATRALLTQVPKPYNTQINDALLTALVRTFSRWTGEPRLFFDLEGHGREASLADVDVARTVGWFTTIFPVLLELDPAAGPAEALVSVKEQLRRVPARGAGFGLLRYLSPDPDVAAALRAVPVPAVAFNYLGQFDERQDGEAPLLRPASGGVGPTRSARQLRRHLIEVNGSVVGGALATTWTYSENLHDRNTIETLAQGFLDELRGLIAHCASADGRYTPSDFPEARLDQKALDRLFAGI